jgi:aminopeptidase-like protein
LNTSPKGEPQLARRGIYRGIGGPVPETRLITLLWILNFSDGTHTLLDIAERSSIPFRQVRQAADLLLEHQLLSLSEE